MSSDDSAAPAPAEPGWHGRSVLVTGGAGFIGSHLVDALVARGARVRVLDDFSTGLASNLASTGTGLANRGTLDVLEASLLDRAACRTACAGVDLVFHQAALGSVPRSVEDPATTYAVNVAGTANLLTEARDAGVARVVYASSSSVYGSSERLPKREGEEGEPLSPYAHSKRVNEEQAGLLATGGMTLVGLRYFNVYGPRQRPDGPYAAVIPRFFTAFSEGWSPRVHGDGEQSRDFTFVADAVQANLLAAEASVDGHRAFNVGSGRRTTINRLAGAIRDLYGTDVSVEHGPARPGDVRHSLADIAAIREVLGYTPAVDLDDGLARTRAGVVGPHTADGDVSS